MGTRAAGGVRRSPIALHAVCVDNFRIALTCMFWLEKLGLPPWVRCAKPPAAPARGTNLRSAIRCHETGEPSMLHGRNGCEAWALGGMGCEALVADERAVESA